MVLVYVNAGDTESYWSIASLVLHTPVARHLQTAVLNGLKSYGWGFLLLKSVWYFILAALERKNWYFYHLQGPSTEKHESVRKQSSQRHFYGHYLL